MISIITVTYNAEKELPITLESVRAQNFNDYEHLIIDGGSTDSTLQLANSFSGRRLRIVSEPDKGLYDAMNKGLRLAKGRYVLFLNAGDAFNDPSVLSLYGKAALRDNDIIFGETVIVDTEGRVLGPRHLSVPETLTFESFAEGMLVCHQAFMAKRSIAPFYDLNYRFSADYDWTVRCLKQGSPEKYVNLKTVTIRYLSDGLTDKNKIASLKERFRIMSRHYGLALTLRNHFKFIFRALRRGRL